MNPRWTVLFWCVAPFNTDHYVEHSLSVSIYLVIFFPDQFTMSSIIHFYPWNSRFFIHQSLTTFLKRVVYSCFILLLFFFFFFINRLWAQALKAVHSLYSRGIQEIYLQASCMIVKPSKLLKMCNKGNIDWRQTYFTVSAFC